MICRRRFLSFAFVVSLAFFFGLFITTQNSFATSVNCGPYTIFGRHNNFSCDTSSLDSSLDWYYNFTFDIQGDFSSVNTTSIQIGFGPTGNASVSGISSYGSIPYFNMRLIPTLLSPYTYTFNDSRRTYSSNNNERLGDVYFSDISWFPATSTKTFSVLITDSFSSGGSSVVPSGNIDITSNGTYDVTSYASATVNVPAEVIQGDYHDDLVNIQKSIIICGAILLVLYFFYCIYRLIIKNSGVH